MPMQKNNSCKSKESHLKNKNHKWSITGIIKQIVRNKWTNIYMNQFFIWERSSLVTPQTISNVKKTLFHCSKIQQKGNSKIDINLCQETNTEDSSSQVSNQPTEIYCKWNKVNRTQIFTGAVEWQGRTVAETHGGSTGACTCTWWLRSVNDWRVWRKQGTKGEGIWVWRPTH